MADPSTARRHRWVFFEVALSRWQQALSLGLRRLKLDGPTALDDALALARLLPRLLRRLVRREPLSPVICQACGAIGEMTIDAVGIENEHPFESWRCRKCEALRRVEFPKQKVRFGVGLRQVIQRHIRNRPLLPPVLHRQLLQARNRVRSSRRRTPSIHSRMPPR